MKQILETLRGDLRASEGLRGNALEKLTMGFLAINMAAIPLYSDPLFLFFFFFFFASAPILLFSCYKVKERKKVAAL